MMKTLKKITFVLFLILTLRYILKSFSSSVSIESLSERVSSESKKNVDAVNHNEKFSKANLKSLNSRQREIFEIIKTLGSVDMSKLSSLFEEVTDRTLRRDLTKLVENKLIEKIGDTKGTVYKLIEV